jgi:hypothetical protein
MMAKIGYPPGATWCDWCHKTLAWKDANFTHDSEALCPKCWPTWLSISEPEQQWGDDSAQQALERGPR